MKTEIILHTKSEGSATEVCHHFQGKMVLQLVDPPGNQSIIGNRYAYYFNISIISYIQVKSNIK